MSSVTHIVDDKKVLNEYEYDAWGEVVKSTETVSNRFKFNGQQLDPITQQYYLRARFYNPVIARFTQEDTYRGDGLNLYAYCRNNPTYYVDPTGNARTCVKDAYDEIRAANPGMSATQAHALAMEQAGVKPKPKNSDNSNDGVNQPEKPKADTPNSSPSKVVPTPPPGYFQDVNGRWHKPNGKFASNDEVGLLPTNDGGLHRPYIRKTTIQAIIKAEKNGSSIHVKDPIADFNVPNGGVAYQIGHITGRENTQLIRDANDLGYSQAQFNDWVNAHPEWFFRQNAELNQSHLGEADYINQPGGTQRYIDRALEIINRNQ